MSKKAKPRNNTKPKKHDGIRLIVASFSAFAAVILFLLALNTKANTGFFTTSTSSVEGASTGKGFDQYGYNNTARIFNGTGSSWCQQKGLAVDCMGIYSPDKLVMKWNAEWDRGNAEGWANPPYNAWEDNQWNGKNGGSGAVWHYKIVWVGSCGADGTQLPNGGYCIWGQFATIMDQGVDPRQGPGHIWYTRAAPAGYGAYK